MCQVNVEDEVRREIIARVAKGDISENVFDSALEALMHDMYANSYKVFMNTTAYKELPDYA